MKPLNPADYPTYNVGDQVTIRQWDDMIAEFGLNKYDSIAVPESFTKEMERCCGKTFTICAGIGKGDHGFPIYRLFNIRYVFTAPMFDQSKLQSVPPSSLSFDDLLQGGD